jgi:phosphatidylglycerophosphate synthase
MRIVVSPIFGYFIYLEGTTGNIIYLYFQIACLALMIISDFFDGFLARLMNQVSDLGKFLDPIADKTASFIVGFFLVYFKGLPLWFFLLTLFREFLAVLVAYLMFSRYDIQVLPNIFGKVATFFMALTCVVYVLSLSFSVFGVNVKDIVLYAVVLLFVLGGTAYVKSYIVKFFDKKKT